MFGILMPPHLRGGLGGLTLQLRALQATTRSRRAHLVVCYLACFVALSGLPYDLIMRSAPFGFSFDDRGKVTGIITFLQWELNHQYILEGLMAAAVALASSASLVALDQLDDLWVSYVDPLVANGKKEWPHLVVALVCGVGLPTLQTSFFCRKWPFYFRDAFLPLPSSFEEGLWMVVPPVPAAPPTFRKLMASSSP